MKRAVLIVLLLAFILAAVHVLAEGIELDTKLEFAPSITPVNGTTYLIVPEKLTQEKSIYNTDGEKLATFPFTDLSYIDYGLFTAYNGEGINNRALVSINGSQITEPIYGAFSALSRNWVLASILTSANEEAYQVKRGKEYFNVERYELYYLEDEPAAAAPVATLTPDQYQSAGVHGDFIAIMAPDESINLYDKTFTACDFAMEKVSTPIYGIQEYAITNLITGDIVADGFTAVKEQNVSAGLWLIGTRYNFKGEKVSGIVNLKGQEIMPAEYTISKVSDGYVIITNEAKLKGLYSLKEQRVIVPCEFNNIMVGNVSTDNYVHNGYVAVENGDLRGYYSVQESKLSCEIKYDRKAVTTVGCSTFWKVEDGLYMLVAADGVETEVRVDEISKKTRGDGYLLVARKDGMYGLIDWHGNEVLPFEHKKTIVITDDSQGLIRTSTGAQLDRMTRK